ncbi:MAG TPA: Gfo/Idh/MocA family oxidoreductase [Terriglobales bacterium]|nr:Gfo/Idh/MocA family oxidoreductase [Terriglobales bacterium]
MVRYGILGFGLHAAKRVMPGFALATNSQVTALSRRDLGKAQESARQFNIPQAFDSGEALCQSPEVDAVFVCSPNSLHLRDTLLAIACGKHVLCEKPMAMNSDEARQMVEAAKKANVILGVAHVFRFEDSTARLRDRIAEGQIGKPVFARSEFSFPGNKEHARTWLKDPAVAGGGAIGDVGVHCIDTLRYILQDEVMRVSTSGITDGSNGVDLAATLTLGFTRGTLGTVLVSYFPEYRTPIEFVGDSGSLFAENGLNVERPIKIELRRGWDVVETETVSNKLAYARQVDTFSAAVEGKAKFPVSGEEGWQNQAILDAAFKGLKSGKTEQVFKVPTY